MDRSLKTQNKITKTPYCLGLKLFMFINVNSSGKLVTSACCDKQQIGLYAYTCNRFYARRANGGKNDLDALVSWKFFLTQRHEFLSQKTTRFLQTRVFVAAYSEDFVS